MDITVSDCPRRSKYRRYKPTTGYADTLTAMHGGVISHVGRANIVRASDHASIRVLGAITTEAIAEDWGTIIGHGNTLNVRATSGGIIALLGDPCRVTVSDAGSVTVFGEPKDIYSAYCGNVTVISQHREYMPDTLTMIDHGDISIVTPGTESHPHAQYLSNHLKGLLPKGDADPRFIAYAGILQKCRTQYLY